MLPMHPNPGKTGHILQVLLTSVVVMLATYPILEWKGIVSFLPIWVIFESMYRLKMRAMMPCPHCGFDPYLQMIDSKKAKEQTIQFWKKKFEDNGLEFLDAEQIRLKKYRIAQAHGAKVEVTEPPTGNA